MRMGIVQMAVGADVEDNLARAAQGVREACRQGAELVALPEIFCCPYASEAFPRYAEPAGGHIWSALAAMARESGAWLVGGSMPELDGGRVYNTSFVFDPQGRQVARHRKVHLFDVDVKGGQHFQESATLTAGDDVTTFETPWGTVGLAICFDIRFPELFRLMNARGARLVIVPAAFNPTTGPLHWELLFRGRAVDGQMFAVGVAPACDEGAGYVSYAHSIACDPWGHVLLDAGTQPSVRVVDLDLPACDEVRAQLPLLSARRTDLYGILDRATGNTW